MIKIDDKRVIIDSIDLKNLDLKTEKEIYCDYKNKIFTAIFTDDIKQNIKILKQLKKKNDRIGYCGIEYKEYILIGIVNNANEEIINCIRAIFIDNKDDRYEFIYNTICNQLDKKWIQKNPCKFENDICICERKNKNPRKNGCCYAFWYKNLGIRLYGIHQCEHLHPTVHCKNQNLSCKLFICTYLKKKSRFKIKINKIMLIQVFLNRYQKIIIRNNYFIEKNQFLEKLKKDEHRIKPLILYYVDRDFLVYKSVPKNKRKLARKYEEIYRNTDGLRK